MTTLTNLISGHIVALFERSSHHQAWEKVEEALSKIPESHHPPLALTASKLLVIKKDEKEEEGAKMRVSFAFVWRNI